MWTGASQTPKGGHGMHRQCLLSTSKALLMRPSRPIGRHRTYTAEDITPGLLQRARRSQCDFSQCQPTCATEEQVHAALQSAASGFVHAHKMHECCDQLTRYEPLGDRCPLFMRKFKAGTEGRLQEVLSPMIAQQAPPPSSGSRLAWSRRH